MGESHLCELITLFHTSHKLGMHELAALSVKSLTSKCMDLFRNLVIPGNSHKLLHVFHLAHLLSITSTIHATQNAQKCKY